MVEYVAVCYLDVQWQSIISAWKITAPNRDGYLQIENARQEVRIVKIINRGTSLRWMQLQKMSLFTFLVRGSTKCPALVLTLPRVEVCVIINVFLFYERSKSSTCVSRCCPHKELSPCKKIPRTFQTLATCSLCACVYVCVLALSVLLLTVLLLWKRITHSLEDKTSSVPLCISWYEMHRR